MTGNLNMGVTMFNRRVLLTDEELTDLEIIRESKRPCQDPYDYEYPLPYQECD